MKPLAFGALMGLSVLVIPAISVADSAQLRYFIGLWEGIDPPDGSLTQRSITCNHEGACEVLGSDSFWSFCGNDRGVLRGEGIRDGRDLRVSDFTLTCFDENGNSDRSITVDTVFVVDRRNRTLLEKHLDVPIPTIVFHRKSR